MPDPLTPANMLDPEEYNKLWKQYGIYVDLFKFYIKSALQASLVYYSVTAIIVMFYFLSPITRESAHLALLFPALFGVLLSVVFWYGSHKAIDLQRNVDEIGRRLELIGTAHIVVLVLFLRAASAAFLLVGILLFPNTF